MVEQRVIVAAFGGNAITRSHERGTVEEQRANVQVMCEEVLPLILAGHRVVLIHGNGPQVGALALQAEAGRALGVPDQPFDILGAMTEGQIGYLIQQSLGNLLRRHSETQGAAEAASIAGRPDGVVALVTQVLVSANDPAFDHPTKPIGPFYDEATAAGLAREKGWTIVQDADRGWRRVVPSPDPIEVVEAGAIRALIDAGAIVVAGGGGGIPVVRDPDGRLRGVEAVIDKDLAAERLASLVGADTLVLLTGVRRVAIAYGSPGQRDLASVTVGEAEGYLAEGQFPAGSMGPKVKAAIRFLRNGGREAIVTAPEALADALLGKEGTRFVRD